MFICYRKSLGAVKTAIFANVQEHRASTPLEPVAQQHYNALHAGWGALQVNAENKAMKVGKATNAIGIPFAVLGKNTR